MAIHIDGYVVDQEIGRGGFGVVYLATQTAFNRPVAIKVLHSGLSADELRKQFARECRAVGSLRRHPNILTVYSTGTTAEGDPYLAMALLTGGSLSQRVPLPPAAVAALGVRLATGLQVAHDGGVIHRDVKPSNVLFDDNDEPVLVDFGISSLAGEASTTSNNIAVSIGYTSPEILDGARPSPATDIYGLGATLFASVTGRTPFVTEGGFSSIAILASRILSQPIEDLRPLGVPDALCHVIETAMAKEPLERYESMAAMRAALEPISDDTTIRAPHEMWGAGSVVSPLIAASASAASTAPSPAAVIAARRRERVAAAMRMHRAVSSAAAVALVAAASVGAAALASSTTGSSRGNGTGAGAGPSPSSTRVAPPSHSPLKSALRTANHLVPAKAKKLATRTTTNAAGATVTEVVPVNNPGPGGGLGGIVAGGRPKAQHRIASTPSKPPTLTLHSLSNTERDSVSAYLNSSDPSGVRVLSTLPKGLQSSSNHIFGTIAADAVDLTSSYKNIRSKTFTISVRVTDSEGRTVTKSFGWTIKDQYIPIAYVGRYGDGSGGGGAPNIGNLYDQRIYHNPNVGVCTTSQEYDSYGSRVWHQSLPKNAPFEWGKRTGSLRIYYLANPADDAGCVSGISNGYG